MRSHILKHEFKFFVELLKI